MDKIIRALGISLIAIQIINIVYLVMFFGNIFGNVTKINGETVYYISWSEIDNFMEFEAIIFAISILLTILLVDHEVAFIETLKRIIRMDEIEER
jgi:hypothetical protein